MVGYGRQHSSGDTMHLTRRTFVTGFGTVIVAPRAAAAQATRMARIGWVAGGRRPSTSSFLDAFRLGLRDHGWIEGQTFLLETRWGAPGQARELTSDLLSWRPDIIVSQGPMIFGARTAAG